MRDLGEYNIYRSGIIFLAIPKPINPQNLEDLKKGRKIDVEHRPTSFEVPVLEAPVVVKR